VSRRARLDAELVRRGLARSREHAASLVAAGQVRVPGRPTVKAATQVDAGEAILLDTDDTDTYVSRGGHKLAGALDVFEPLGLGVAGRRCLDAGASTGGFTDVLLRRGAAHVVCVDVGYGQLAWSLQTDDRVEIRDRTNIRALEDAPLDPPAELVVADLSFISLRIVLPALLRSSTPGADLLLMVKPQFEVGRERLGAGGVVREPELRAAAVGEVAEAAYVDHGVGVLGVTASPLPGPMGNVEYFLWLRRGAPPVDPAEISRAVAAGPS
jgi:23S rRNA (cytidine1920-2'-O)/16S rRNA (cytidine1409-2'-O)-methyltransferase